MIVIDFEILLVKILYMSKLINFTSIEMKTYIEKITIYFLKITKAKS